jgi:hypothetical protein
MYFEAERGIDKNLVMRLAECTFIVYSGEADPLFR